MCVCVFVFLYFNIVVVFVFVPLFCRGFGFVTFTDAASVDKVLAQQHHELDSKTVSKIHLLSHCCLFHVFCCQWRPDVALCDWLFYCRKPEGKHLFGSRLFGSRSRTWGKCMMASSALSIAIKQHSGVNIIWICFHFSGWMRLTRPLLFCGHMCMGTYLMFHWRACCLRPLPR